MTMAAQDYRICPAFIKAYIAKVSKCNPNLMTDDRREIEQNEILALIDWYLDNQLGDKYHQLTFDSMYRDGMSVKLTYVKLEEKNKSNENDRET